MKNCTWLLILFNIFIYTYKLNAQAVTVIFIDGDAKVSSKSSGKSGFTEKSNNLGYGPVSESQTIELSGSSVVKLIRDDGSQCQVNGPGTFNVKDLKFEKVEAKSTFSAFMDYFKSFFVAHPNSESKEHYSNSIAAISKGEMIMPPLLSFPFPGALPLMNNGINFSWEASCDTCVFILTIQDLSNKKIVVELETYKHTLNLTDPDKYFSLNKKYLWIIEVKNSDSKSVSQLFTIVDQNEYKSKIASIENSFKSDNPYLNPATQMICVIAALEKEKLTNYIMLYGQDQVNRHPRDPVIKGIYERVYYDNLKRKRI